MTQAMFRYLDRQVGTAEFGQTSDLERRIAEDRNLTKAERIMLGQKLEKRLREIAAVGNTP